MPSLLSDESIFTFESQGYSDELRVLRVSGTEGLSELFSFKIELAARDGEIDLDALVGVPAQLDIYYEDGTRSVFGIVSRFEQGVAGESFTPYYAELVPTVWLLTQRHKSRIFQGKTVQEIVEQVLTDAEVQSDYFRFALQRTNYVTRDYCVQYRETDWNFISRLLEEEGIFYFFEHQDQKDVLVMADSSDVHIPIDGVSDVVFRDVSGAVEAEEFIYDFRYSQQIRPGTAVLKDYNFERPTLDLTKNEPAERDPALEVYDFPGLYTDEAIGADLVRIRLQSAQAKRLVGEGQSVCRRLVPGNKFTLADYPRSSFNQEYLLTSVQHQGTQPLGQDDAGGRFKYDNRFQCIPSDTPFRPARKTPKPVVEGSQTAVVTGPSGEEVYVDQHGRVKVQFPWDREGQNDENSSCWIRVSQLWAGTGWGAMFIPRIGHEVIVDFLEGDPDRPIITGRVYNGDNTTPYPLDAEKTKSTIKSDSTKGGGGSNEIRFEDKKGQEEVYVHAQRDMNEKIERNMSTSVGADQSLSVGHDRTKTITNDETNTIKGNRNIEITKNLDIKVHGNRDKHVDGKEKCFIDSRQEYYIKGGRVMQVSTGGETYTVYDGRTKTIHSREDVTINGPQTTTINGTQTATVNGKRTETVSSGGEQVDITGNTVHNVTGDMTIHATGKLNGVGDTEVHVEGPKITVQANGECTIVGAAKLKLAGPGGSIEIGPAGITIQGIMVNIN